MSEIHDVLLVLLLVVGTHADVAAQQATSTETKPPAPRTLTLSGCVNADPSKPGSFTLVDSKSRPSYQLTGADVRGYAGRRVQVSGVKLGAVHVVGGLFPTPNVAGQAGAIDPAKAAVAARETPGAVANQPLSEFRVKRVRALPGTCPPG